jgi:prevent-host-death family protein
MSQYVSVKEFKQRFTEIVEDLKRTGEIVVLKRSKPLFKVIPFEEISSDLLNRASTIEGREQPDLQEISRIVHKLRAARGKGLIDGMLGGWEARKEEGEFRGQPPTPRLRRAGEPRRSDPQRSMTPVK